MNEGPGYFRGLIWWIPVFFEEENAVYQTSGRPRAIEDVACYQSEDVSDEKGFGSKGHYDWRWLNPC